MRLTATHWLLLGLLSLLWGGTFFFVSLAVREVPPLSVVLLRVALAAAALFLFLKLSGIAIARDRRVWRAFLAMGCLNNVIPFSLFFWAQTTIPGGLASIANATTPVFSIAIAHFLLVDERFTPSKLAGVMLALVGVGFLVGEEVAVGLGMATIGLLACLAASLCQGFAVVYGRRFERLGVPSAVGAFGQLLATTLVMIPFVLLIDQPWRLSLPSLGVIGSILGLALLSTALAYVIFFRLLATAGAVNASLVTLLIPASAILLGVGLLDETLAPRQLVGLGFISLGLLVIDGRLLGQLVRHRSKRSA